jgi:hypothetical protein
MGLAQQGWRTAVGITQLGGLNYLGTWDASTNTPTITSGVGNTGDYYVVSVAGNTNIDGITDWEVGDWIIFNGSFWQKIDNTDQVSSVNGQQGAVIVDLESALSEGNTTGAYSISINSGQNITFNNGGFTGQIVEGTYTGNHIYTLPNGTGTIALTSQIPVELNDLTDVNTNLPVSPTNADDGKLLYLDVLTGLWTTDDNVDYGTVVLDCKKGSAGTILKGTPVAYVGYDNDLVEVEPADASNPALMPCIGIAGEDITNTNDPKKVLKFGKVQGLNTNAYNEGDILYVASGGGFTITRPTGTAQIQRIAKVIRKDISGGQLITFNTFRTAGLPNLANGNIWIGDASGYPIEVPATNYQETLAQTLALGNTTGANDISVDNGQKILFGSASHSIYQASNNINIENTVAGRGVIISTATGGVVTHTETSTVFENTANPTNVTLTYNTGNANISFFNGTSVGTLIGSGTTLPRNWTLPDNTGTIALLSDIPATPTLSAVLTAGNVTNGQNIISNFDSVIRTNNATPLNRMALQLFNDTTDYMALGSDLFAPNLIGGSVQLYNNELRIGVYDGVGLNGVSLQFLESSKEVRLSRNSVASSNYDFYITGSIDLYLGGASGGVGKGLLKPTTLTADRTYTLQDASGTLAFLTDIPSTPTLSAVLTAGNVTGANDILMDSASGVRNISTNNATTADRTAISFIEIGGGAMDGIIIARLNQSSGSYGVYGQASGGFGYFTGTSVGHSMEANLGGVSLVQSDAVTSKNFTLERYWVQRFRSPDNAVAYGNLTRVNLTADRTWTFKDESGTIAFLSDIPALPANIVTGTGTINYNARWTSSSTIGDGIIQDNGTTAGVNSPPFPSRTLQVTGHTFAGQVQAITGDSRNGTTSNLGVDGIAGGGTGQQIAIRGTALASGAGGISIGGNFLSIASCPIPNNPLTATPFTSIGFISNVGTNTGNASHKLGGYICNVQSSADDNVGLYIEVANGGAGNGYAMLIEDGNQGAGKVLTCVDANGYAEWGNITAYDTGQTYTVQNVSVDRAYDADSTTIDELADIVGTLITDLQSVNILS